MGALDKSPAASDPLCGFLLVDKPAGLSSMQAIARIRKAAAGARTGHAGTLDPLATGLLVVAIGKATRSLKHITGLDKRYQTLIDLSAFTATDDAEGAREEVPIANMPTCPEIAAALHTMTGEVMQRPPTFSAVKVGGRRAYALSRNGMPPKMPPRQVSLHDAAILDYEWPILTLALHTGSGFYVRSLARDLGMALGTGGYCASIRRTAVGDFRVENAYPLDRAGNRLVQNDLIPIDEFLQRVGAER